MSVRLHHPDELDAAIALRERGLRLRDVDPRVVERAMRRRSLGGRGRRSGSGGGGASGPVNTVAPVLGEAYAGASPTITPGTWTGAPTLTYSLEVNGVEVVSGDEATVEAYVYVLGDEGYDAILYESADGGAAVASNTVVVAAAVLGALTGTTRVRLRADAYNASTGTCTDTGGEGNHALQATSGFRPTLGTANGRAAMVLDGIDDRLQTPTFIGGACTLPTTIFAVANMGGAAGVNRAICDGRISTNRNVVWWKSTNVWDMFGVTDVPMVGGNAAVRTVSAIAATFNGASSVGYFNDWDTDICPGNCGIQVLEGLTVGAAFSGGTLNWIGTINEILVVEGATAGDILAVRAYFRDYYGLSFLA